ncbi:hypothetical protein BKA82DRAFT_154053 [Pisolithus tinctorius]|uniref:Uncharacterized protein n=1 Tax=Pisolithus tinctorius Marx 270 TaxID=870435 RepID=A0A0C3JQZ2_PISTI|nr:hypothetical protein BKA82DRAFT_154053 [Pisolithus tinctorius]KIN99896.1 hypothetical protein M404DRAFT_154053 [Pisolithus tinctorius Marx 270]
MPAELGECRPHPKPAPYNQQPRAQPTKSTPATSAILAKPKRHENLTLNDWLTVFAYIDEHPDLPQDQVVSYFSS